MRVKHMAKLSAETDVENCGNCEGTDFECAFGDGVRRGIVYACETSFEKDSSALNIKARIRTFYL